MKPGAVHTDRGELSSQTLQKGGSGSWVDEQSSERTYFDNGLLKTLTNKNAAGSMVEQHTLDYVTGGVFVNGNRVSDVFQRKGPDSGATCYSATCTASWSYDARDRLVYEDTGACNRRSPFEFSRHAVATGHRAICPAPRSVRAFRHGATDLLGMVRGILRR